MIASSTCAACEILGRCSRCRRLDEISKPPRWQIMLHGKLLLEMESKPEAEVVAYDVGRENGHENVELISA